MRKPINLISGGLMGLVVGASSFVNGCEEPQGRYNDNQQQRNDAGQAGLDLLQFTLGLYGVAGDGTPQQRNAAGFTSNLIGEEKRNEAIRNSGTTVNVYNDRRGQGQQQVYVQQPTAQIEKVWVDFDSFDENGNKGMNIHSKLRVREKRENKLKLIAYFYYENGEKLKDRDGFNRSSDGHVSVAGEIIVPPYDDTTYNDAVIFLPYKQLDIIDRGNHKLKLQVLLWDCPQERCVGELVRSDFYNFYVINN